MTQPDVVDVKRLRAALARRSDPLPASHDDPGHRAAVLVPLIEQGARAGVVLTCRASGLRQHAGQVAFPGGRIDSIDTGPEATALREAEEEIGLAPSHVRLLGRLPAVITGTGFHVTPVVGLVEGNPSLRPAPDEVAQIFHLPWCLLRNRRAPYRRTVDGDARSVWVWPHVEYDIWGATAAILVDLAAALDEA